MAPELGRAEANTTGEAYRDELEALRGEISSGGARPSVIDKSVGTLLTFGDRRLVSDLLTLLSDNTEYDEAMFSIIHAAESFDDDIHIQALLSEFPRLIRSSSRWSSIVLMRVLNNDRARLEAVRQLRGATALIKDSVRIVCERINDIDPQFLSRTTPLWLAAAPV